MLVNFTKMHGLGNDFVVIDLITQPVRIRVPHIKRLGDRRLGVGCDQVLLIEPPLKPDAHFHYRVFNANGQEVEQCGNGLRCAARFFYDMGFTNQSTLRVDCIHSASDCLIEDNGLVTVNLGIPQFKPKDIPINAKKQAATYKLRANDQEFEASILSIGNPHAIIQTPKLKSIPLATLGPLLSEHELFPNGANIGFMEILDRSQIRLGVYERGAGETLACGSNACAAVISGIKAGLLDSPCNVLFAKGTLSIAWKGPNSPVYMTGPTKSVFTGQFRL